VSHIQAAKVKKITERAKVLRFEIPVRAHADDDRIAKQRKFCQIRNKKGTMSTKTAILSIANLKADDLPVLREAFLALPGVEKIDFSIERSVAVIDFDPNQSHIDDFLRAALKAGFQVL
jgi:hypothetical protein